MLYDPSPLSRGCTVFSHSFSNVLEPFLMLLNDRAFYQLACGLHLRTPYDKMGALPKSIGPSFPLRPSFLPRFTFHLALCQKNMHKYYHREKAIVIFFPGHLFHFK